VLKPPQGIDLSGLFSPFDLTSHHQVIAAVSGGSDSTALLLLLKQHLDEFAPAVRLVAVTVDHGLRPESAREAADVAGLCAGIGVAHRILIWTGEKPAAGIAAAAREARHELLAEAARKEGATLVLTGHTADDQAETVMMRQARGSAEHGGRGIAGIAPATLFDGRVWFARPLLSTRREALRKFLGERQVEWIDDPTNANENYERPRLRKELGREGGETIFAEALATAAEAAQRRENLGREAAELIDAHAYCPALGLLRLQPGFFSADRNAAVYALRILLAMAGGMPHLPDDARAAALHARLAGKEPVRTVLSRALVVRRKESIFLLREARNLPETNGIRDGTIWDGRYRLVAVRPEKTNASPRTTGKTTSAEPVPDSLLRAAQACQPALPPAWTAVPIVVPWQRYLPSFDIAPARAAARLVGAPQVPASPFLGHIESKA